MYIGRVHVLGRAPECARRDSGGDAGECGRGRRVSACAHPRVRGESESGLAEQVLLGEVAHIGGNTYVESPWPPRRRHANVGTDYLTTCCSSLCMHSQVRSERPGVPIWRMVRSRVNSLHRCQNLSENKDRGGVRHPTLPCAGRVDLTVVSRPLPMPRLRLIWHTRCASRQHLISSSGRAGTIPHPASRRRTRAVNSEL